MTKKIHNMLKWFYPGIGVKRWIGLGIFGVLLLIFATGHLRAEEFLGIQILDSIILFSGIIILILGIKRMMRSFIAAFVPSSRGGEELFDIIYQNRQLSRGPRIVVIGGGTGLSVLLTGLKQLTTNLSAIVTVADDGGSSGRIREEFGMLPPGDIRNCLVALADAPALMRDLFQFRFTTNSELAGHSFGNLFITVMTQLTGDFEKAIKETSKVLALRGQVIPSTLNKVVLVAEHKDGSTTVGENQIPKTQRSINKVYLNPAHSSATPDAIKAIKEARIIVLGPGSLYTSIIPNLLIPEISEAVASAQALKVYVCNAMTQPGETDGFSASEHIKVLVAHSHQRILDYCIVNTGEIPPAALKRYIQQGARLVANDRKKIEDMGYRVIEDDFATVEDGVIRHDAEKLARIILGLIEEI
ncbi:MAG: YvcK family protein [Candidatus Omnitrophica bacterium]|nr:YvcK family protein [Candidatus Omnitrophota bacterium]